MMSLAVIFVLLLLPVGGCSGKHPYTVHYVRSLVTQQEWCEVRWPDGHETHYPVGKEDLYPCNHLQ